MELDLGPGLGDQGTEVTWTLTPACGQQVVI